MHPSWQTEDRNIWITTDRHSTDQTSENAKNHRSPLESFSKRRLMIVFCKSIRDSAEIYRRGLSLRGPAGESGGQKKPSSETRRHSLCRGAKTRFKHPWRELTPYRRENARIGPKSRREKPVTSRPEGPEASTAAQGASAKC